MRRKRSEEHPNHERWLISYADFITLLFAFFVVMYANGQTDKTRAQQVAESVRQAFEHGYMPAKLAAILGGTVNDVGPGNAQRRGPGGREAAQAPVADLAQSLKRLTAELEQEIKEGKLQVSLNSRGLVVSLKEAAFFPSGEDRIPAERMPVMAKLARVILDLPNAVRLEGHTDAVPIHNARFRSNWELSAARSIAVLDLFENTFKIPRSRLAVAGYADTAPVASNDTAEGRARNRRVDVVILTEQALKAEARGKQD
jgi:chemotaxis protein MotB